MSYVIESAEERVAKILRAFKEPIVCDVFPLVIPDSFGCIQFRPVRRKLKDFHVAAVGFEPVINFPLLVVRRVVLNQIDPTRGTPSAANTLISWSQAKLWLERISE
jgi:hypothetical protein